MIRLALLAFLIPAPASALDSEAGTAACAATTAVVADAIALRAQGKEQDEVAAVLETSDLDPAYLATIKPLVAWVYDLPPDQLNDKAASAYNDACLMQLN